MILFPIIIHNEAIKLYLASIKVRVQIDAFRDIHLYFSLETAIPVINL